MTALADLEAAFAKIRQIERDIATARAMPATRERFVRSFVVKPPERRYPQPTEEQLQADKLVAERMVEGVVAEEVEAATVASRRQLAWLALQLDNWRDKLPGLTALATAEIAQTVRAIGKELQ